jgi:hypothetical protein
MENWVFIRKLALIPILCLPLAALTAETTKSAIPIPAGPEILSHLTKAHPRLLASSNDFARLKLESGTKEPQRSWEAALRAQAAGILTATPSKYEIPDGLRLLDTSRRVMNRVYTLGLMYRLTGEQQYAERAWNELSAAAEFKDWNPRHFLDTAEMTHAFAIGYDWFYDVWTPEQRETLRQAIVEKGFKPALALYRTQRGFSRIRNNWNQVCNGGIGMGALALGDVEPELAGEILADGLRSIQIGMAEFAPDGASVEGPGYWNYATIYNCVFLAGLESTLGTDFGLSQMPAFRDTGLFPIYLTGPLGRTFNYADGGDKTIHAAQMFWLARKFDRPIYALYERQVAAPAPLDLLWFTPVSADTKMAQLPLDKYFRGPEVVTLRSAWEGAQALFVGFKAGDNKVSHSHLDLGSFVFDAFGIRWAMDLGADDYNLPAYFGDKRWTYYRLRAEGQNTLAINPTAAPDQDPQAATKILRFQSKPEASFAIADLTPAYRKDASKVWRGIKLLNKAQVLIQDEIQADKPADIWWFMHTPAAMKIENDGHIAELSQVGKKLRAEILSPSDAKFEIRDAHPLPTSPQPEHQARNENARKLTIHVNGAKTLQLSVLLSPVTAQQEAPKLRSLSEW